ncbi:hypothetical protein D3C80_1170830 [compost metagenome]
MASITHFHEYYGIAVEHDQIQLAKTAAPVARQQAQAVLLQVGQRPAFGGLAKGLARAVAHWVAVSRR